MNQLRKEIPQNYTRRYHDIKRMLGAKLRYLDTSIYQLHHLITHAVYFVAEYERVFFMREGSEVLLLICFQAL